MFVRENCPLLVRGSEATDQCMRDGKLVHPKDDSKFRRKIPKVGRDLESGIRLWSF
jgi:hypothetical protein